MRSPRKMSRIEELLVKLAQPQPAEMRIGDIRVRSLVFSLEGSPREAGHSLRRRLFATRSLTEMGQNKEDDG